MEVWQFILYGTAALLALKSLSSLMTLHRDNLIREIEAQDELRRQEEARAQAEAAAAKKKNRRSGAA
jgi:hypothetical protein